MNIYELESDKTYIDYQDLRLYELEQKTPVGFLKYGILLGESDKGK